ncbi:hypothetical protein BC936DRAFT_144139, partial [Jimgerdemannia flammicorona]
MSKSVETGGMQTVEIEDAMGISQGTASTFGNIKRKLTTKGWWVGEYNFAFLCLPNIPLLRPKTRTPPPFFGLDTELPIALCCIMGFQHAL